MILHHIMSLEITNIQNQSLYITYSSERSILSFCWYMFMNILFCFVQSCVELQLFNSL